jgi:integrase/recombinase XerC
MSEKPPTEIVVRPVADLLRRELSIIESFWEGRSPKTIKAYRENLLRIAAWKGIGTIEEFAEIFLAAGPGEAFKLAHEFKGWAITTNKWSPSYINNHLAALRSLVKFARHLSRITWALDIKDVEAQPYRDTRGPGFEGMVAIVSAAAAQENAWIAARDTALMMLFTTMGLRRFEAVGLDLEHVDARGRRIAVLPKKQLQRVWITLPIETYAVLAEWLTLRGNEPGPLFLSQGFGRLRSDRRLADSSVWKIVHDLAAGVGLKAWPHALRHAAITEVLERSDGNIRNGQKFARHSDPKVTTVYDDNRTDVAGEMAGVLARAIAEARAKRRNNDP